MSSISNINDQGSSQSSQSRMVTRATQGELHEYVASITQTTINIQGAIGLFEYYERRGYSGIRYTLLLEGYRECFVRNLLGDSALTYLEVHTIHKIALFHWGQIATASASRSVWNSLGLDRIQVVIINGMFLAALNRSLPDHYPSKSPVTPVDPADKEEIQVLFKKLPLSFWQRYAKFDAVRPNRGELQAFAAEFSEAFSGSETRIVLEYLSSTKKHIIIRSLLTDALVDRYISDVFNNIAFSDRERRQLSRIDLATWTHLDDGELSKFTEKWVSKLSRDDRAWFRQVFITRPSQIPPPIDDLPID